MKSLSFLGFNFYSLTEDGKVYSLKSKRFMKTNCNNKGYQCITLWQDEKSKSFSIHRLVAMCYVHTDLNFSDMQINHKDGNKLNNHFSNLEWCTLQENVQHSVYTGLRDSQKGYTDEEIHVVCSLLQEGLRNIDIEEMTGVHRSKISMIKNGCAYQHVSAHYVIPVVKRANRISINKLILICEKLQAGETMRDIAKELDVGYQLVRFIYRREAHSELSRNYKW